MEREVLAYVDLDGALHFVGHLWARTRGNNESASFEYDKLWLENPVRFSMEPALQLGPGPYRTAGDVPMWSPRRFRSRLLGPRPFFSFFE